MIRPLPELDASMRPSLRAHCANLRHRLAREWFSGWWHGIATGCTSGLVLGYLVARYL